MLGALFVGQPVHESQSQRQRERFFTLVELLTVIVVIELYLLDSGTRRMRFFALKIKTNQA